MYGGIGLRFHSFLFSTKGGDGIQRHIRPLYYQEGTPSFQSCLFRRAGLAVSETIKDLFHMPGLEPSFPVYWIRSSVCTWAAINVLLSFLINFLEVPVKVNNDPLSASLAKPGGCPSWPATSSLFVITQIELNALRKYVIGRLVELVARKLRTAVHNLWFLQRCKWTFPSSGIWRRVCSSLHGVTPNNV